MGTRYTTHLLHPRTRPFELATNESQVATGAVLNQVDDLGVIHIVTNERVRGWYRSGVPALVWTRCRHDTALLIAPGPLGAREEEYMQRLHDVGV